MVSLETPVCDFGRPAVDFSLPGIDGKNYTLKDCAGENGLLVMFICNHCPYVKAIRERLVRDTKELRDKHGINSVAIMSNDPSLYEEDSFENMQKIAAEFAFPFPYLLDETQQIAKAFGAVCTPDFFGYNKDLELQYRGRLDESRKEAAIGDVRRDLFLAMQEVARSGKGPVEQIPSMGCSIKWKDE
ncbi:MAG: thioredoxin family protein [Gammaproteobacteria bacterium]|nr:thioredoxin family protein [Gammaproteobacteria bacterium]